MESSPNEGPVQLSLIPYDKEKLYYIMEFPYYATIVFYGSYQEALEFFKKTKAREKQGSWRLADPDNKIDRDIVVEEIQAIREDKQAGIKGLPFYPSKNWF